MAAAPKVSHITAKQHAADVANLRKARAVGRTLPRTAKQKAASRANLGKARAAQKARRSGKKAVAPKKPKAPLPVILGATGSLDKPAPRLRPTGLPVSLHDLPACGPVALAAHLDTWTGTLASADEILALHQKSSGQFTLADLLELVAAEGFAGARLASFRRCDEDLTVPGLLYGIQLAAGYHAVLLCPDGMTSWGTVLSLAGSPEEAWHLEWEAA